MDPGPCLNDHSLGPSVSGCRDDFDFTLAFERIFFAILPGSLFIAACLARLAYLLPRPGIVSGAAFKYTKLAVIAVYASIQLAILALIAADKSHEGHRLSIAATAIPFIASLFMIALSFAEHSKSPRPSFLLSGYILLTLLLDIAQVRTSWLVASSSRETVFARLFTASVAAKVVLLVVEAWRKSRWVRWNLEEHSPEEVDGIFGLGVYTWLNRLFTQGYSTVLSLSDLYPLDTTMMTEAVYPEFEKRLQPPRYIPGGFSLARALFRSLLVPWLLPVLPRLCLIGFKYAQPFFLRSLLIYLQSTDIPDTMSRNIGYGFIGAAALIYVGIAVSGALFHYYNYRAVYMVRSCLASAIYKKTTEARSSVGGDAAALTLMSTDVERIVRNFNSIHDLWGTTVEVAIGSWLLYQYLGAAFVAPILTILACAVAVSLASKYSGRRQQDWMVKIQKRVGLTAGAIANIKGLKITGIVDHVYDIIQALRADEIVSGNRWRLIVIYSALIGMAPGLLSPVFTFAVTSRTLGTTDIYTSMSYLMLVTTPLSTLFQTIPGIVASFACLRRIQNFLEAEPRVDYRKFSRSGPLPEKYADLSSVSLPAGSEKSPPHIHEPVSEEPVTPAAATHPVVPTPPPPAIRLSSCNFGWVADKIALKNIIATIPAGQLTMIVGPVASGKSTFCHALLGEVPYVSGEVIVDAHPQGIGFCEQSPFLLNATLKENIVGYSSFDQAKYDEIIEATRLSTDISLMPEGHDTKIGSNGMILSGGQKQRVSLARALYLESDMLIFDDILSGLDNDTETEVFNRVFGPEGMLRRRGSTAVICTHSIRHLPAADHIIALGSEGTLVEEGSFQDLMKNNLYVHNLGVKASSNSDSAESSASSAAPSDAEPAAKSSPSAAKPKPKVLERQFDKARQMGDWKVYVHYFSAVRKAIITLILVMGVLYGFGENFSTIWLGFWAEDKLSRDGPFYIGIFALLRTMQLVWVFLIGTAVLVSLVKISGNAMHAGALRTVITAPLTFFTTTDIGVVTNLFSQDMTIIDGELPMALLNMLLIPFNLIGMAFVIATATPYLAIGYVVLGAVLYMLQKFYLRTSRQIRLLDLEAKSPLYSHFIDTIKGIATIRAFAWVPQNVSLNNDLLNNSQRPVYLLIMIQQWLTLVLQLVVAALALGAVALATQLSAAAGFAGASLVTLMSFGELMTYMILMYTLLETSIGAVARLKTFGEVVKSEDLEGEDLRPGEEWPPRGQIEIRDISASYTTDTTGGEDDEKADSEEPRMALRNLSISIQPGEKVAVCGRTGSGKSSLFLLLLRLLDPTPASADIQIDSIPLYKIHRPTLRKRIIAVPQDPILLPGASSLLANLDPDKLATEAECLEVLKTVHLGSLSSANVEELSAGQKQLLSLGRAILRRRMKPGGGLLLLDEVGSSVDRETDRAMGEVIQREFDGYTIVMIAHRLEMVRDYFDKVVVMDQGSVVEVGAPRTLVGVEGSRFRELWVSGNYEDVEVPESSQIFPVQNYHQYRTTLRSRSFNHLAVRFNLPITDPATDLGLEAVSIIPTRVLDPEWSG
ncbi:related to multidrug resistance protein [Cephalotrichum gorgonifer]|uniref:Related to multidrug resistance protein n=1 Tax=Cephalotrichum gorgonifer TaxID=2041049 RepID=A0AAE8MQE1_9PEZI|nr:related to multidrug resistance protein [Cephalotrichum gorgonifer]